MKLPASDRRKLGHVITIKNVGSSGTLNVIPTASGDTIDGLSSKGIDAGDCFQYVCAEPGKWIEVGPRASGGSGWVWAPTAVQTAAYVCTAMYELVRVDNSGGAISVTLPAITSADIGKMVCIKSVTNSPGGLINPAASAGQSILESAALAMNQAYDSLVFSPVTATQWLIVAHYSPGAPM